MGRVGVLPTFLTEAFLVLNPAAIVKKAPINAGCGWVTTLTGILANTFVMAPRL